MLNGIVAQSPSNPTCPQVVMSGEPRLRVLEKMPSAWASVNPRMGLSLWTYTARQSRATLIRVGLKPCFCSKASSSSGFMVRDIGPSWAVPAVKAGGAVAEPFPST